MKSNERLMTALRKAMELKPDVEIGKFLRYIASCSDLAYMSDDDISMQIENYNHMNEKYRPFDGDYEKDATDINYLDKAINNDSEFSKLYNFSKENEQIAYDRYKAETKGRVYFSLEERLDLSDFLNRFSLEFVKADDYKGINVINHRDNFLDMLPIAYRHMNAYVIGRKGGKYIAMHKYAVKIPCFGELFACVTFGMIEDFDEIFSIAIDWDESPRFTDYTKHIMYGVSYRPDKSEMEIYNEHQTIEIFHELMQKSNRLTTNWDFGGNGILYDDGTID